MNHGLPRTILVGLLVAAGVAPCLADDETTAKREIPLLSDSFYINLGGYLTEFKTDASVGSGNVLGAFLRLEDELGVESDPKVVRLDGAYRFNRKHAIGFSFWSLDRRGASMIGGSLDIGDETFAADATLESELKTSLFRVDWRYSLLRTDRGEAGLVVGLSNFKFDLAFQGEIEVQAAGQNPQKKFGRVEESVFAPVPSVGIFLTHSVTRRLIFNAQAAWLDAEIGDLEAKVQETLITMTYYFTPWIGLGIGGNRVDISYKDSGEDPLQVEYGQSGALAYLALTF